MPFLHAEITRLESVSKIAFFPTFLLLKLFQECALTANLGKKPHVLA